MAKKNKNAFNTVTPLSKTIALALFVALPFIGFYLGIQYQKALDANKFIPESPIQKKACTMEAKLCPDGTYVGRSGPNCEFAPCPGIKKQTP